MNEIPFTPFKGLLKQLTFRGLPESYHALFKVLFPHFFDEFEVNWSDSEVIRRLFEALSPLVQVEKGRQPRRFGGFMLPRGRYFTLCSDSHGDDGGTLVHELRAYRDPVATGMVEVVDFGLAENLVLIVGRDELSFPRSREVGVLIHEPARIPRLLDEAPSRNLRSQDGRSLTLLKFPYDVREEAVARTVDLRQPETRAWFAGKFSVPRDDIIWPENQPLMSEVEPAKTFASRYDVSDGRAPVPRTFVQMLPTLLNPGLGGGGASGGGVTLMAIGQWLENQGVEALIYPSARCDVVALFQNGALVRSEGWCLVDYRSSDAAKVSGAVMDSSPWSWTHLPRGVSVHLGPEGSEFAGSLVVQGMVETGAKEYLEKVASLREAEEAVGPARESMTLHEAWTMGTSALRWLRLATLRCPEDEVTRELRIFRGLGLRNGADHIAGAVGDIYTRLTTDGNLVEAMRGTIAVASRLQDHCSEQQETTIVIGGAIDLELVLLLLAVLSLRRHGTLGEPLAADGLKALALPPRLQDQVDTFLASISRAGEGVEACAIRGAALAANLEAFYGPRRGSSRR